MCLLLTSCTSYKVVQIPDNIESEIHEGDIVKIVTKDGRDLEFKVVSVTSEGVIGENQQVIRFSDVVQLEKQEVSATKTAGLIVVGLAALFVILLVVAVSAFLITGHHNGLRYILPNYLNLQRRCLYSYTSVAPILVKKRISQLL